MIASVQRGLNAFTFSCFWFWWQKVSLDEILYTLQLQISVFKMQGVLSERSVVIVSFISIDMILFFFQVQDNTKEAEWTNKQVKESRL